MKTKNMTTLSLEKSISRSPLGRSLLFIPLVLCCFALWPAPKAFGVSPAPDGGYPGGNTAEGTESLFSITTGVWNSAVGFRALYKNATGIRNTAVGYQALYNNNGPLNSSGLDNVAVGADALFNNTTGETNIAIGSFALYHNTTGSNNIAIGDGALRDFMGSGATAIGDSFYSDSNGVEIGARRGCETDISPTASIHGYDIFIGDPAGCPSAPANCNCYGLLGTHSVNIVVDEFVGAVFVGGVNNHPLAGSPVVIDSSGQLGVATSSQRFKTEIKPMDKASEALFALKPVTFRYKKSIDPKGAPQFGLVAEDVEKVNPDLVAREADGKVFTVRYEAVNAMLLNEFLKEHRKVEELEVTAAHQQKQIEALTAGLQRVSAQVEMSHSAPEMVFNQ
jgi:hypothetical protein